MDPSSFFYFQAKDVLNGLILICTIVAIIYGPIVAFKVAREYEKAAEKRKRQHAIFYTLMKTRRLHITQERVAALNTIQLDFYGYEKIGESYKVYIDHLETTAPKNEDEGRKFFEKREDLFYEMLYQIGKALDYSLDRRDMQKLAYMPEGWNTEDQEIKTFRRYLTEMLDGRRYVPVARFRPPSNSSKFPPPPS